jgi:hypothetical protein
VSAFNLEIGITGAILTKLDGDSRGGAALSVREVCFFFQLKEIMKHGFLKTAITFISLHSHFYKWEKVIDKIIHLTWIYKI